MDDIQPPSFSLGFDLDLDSELQQAPAPETSSGNNSSKPVKRSSPGTSVHTNSAGADDFETPPMGLFPRVLGPTTTLKRLRRGPALAAERPEPKEEKFIADDDIEEFSSEDDQPPDDALKHHYSLSSSSKFPLNGHGPHAFLASQSTKVLNEIKKKNVKNPSGSSDEEAISNKLVFPNLHVSPLRRFQLIESDSDEASPCKGPNEVVSRVSLPAKDGAYTFGQVGTAGESKKTKAPDIISQADDLWKEIPSDKSFSVPTPALDEICEEHFRFVKDKKESHKFGKSCFVSSNLRTNEMPQLASGFPHPAYLYYYHEDSRIQKLVRARLSHFLPLSCGNNQGVQQHDSSTINYMGQFNHGEASKQSKKSHNIGSSSSKSRKKSRKSSAVDEQEGWINPRIPEKTAKDAGKKRVQGVCKSAGHWYTAADGRRVYVAGNGQELTGQIAYRQYKRESGARFKRSNKKAASKKKPTRKKK